MAERPIFVVGYQRSGTTLLQSLLGAHPRIAAPPEVHFWFRIVELADYWGDLSVDSRAAAVVHELLDAPLGMLDGAGFDEAEITAAFLRTDRSYAALLDTAMSDFARRHGKQRWSEKSPHQRPSRIWSLLPEAQILHIVRDPRDVAASEAEVFHRMPAWRSAERVRHFTERSLADAATAAADTYHRVRYEDLAAEPERVMRAVCAFLGEDFPDQLVTASRSGTSAIPSASTPWQHEAAMPIRAPRSAWQDRLDFRERALVCAIVADLLPVLDYPPSPPKLVRLGKSLRPTTLPAKRAEQRRRTKIVKSAGTPADRHAAVKAFIDEQTQRWKS
jgi:hypothetical protein